MRRTTFGLLATVVIIGLSLVLFYAPTQADTRSSTISPAQSTKILDASWQLIPPTIDGNLSDWAAYEHVILDNTTADAPPEGARPSPEDLSGWTSIVWDSQWLYIALDVTDDLVVRNSRNWMNDDMAGYVFDVDQDGQLGVADLRFTLSPDGVVTLNGGWPYGVKWVIERTEQGWKAEMAIPIVFFGSDFLTDAQVGFSWGLQDDDGQGVEGSLVWGGPSYTAPTPQEGLMRFINGPTRSWLTYRLGDEGWAGIEDTTLNSWPGNETTNFGADPILSIRGNNQWHAAMKITLPTLPPGARPLRLLLHMSLADVPRNPNNGGDSRARAYPLLRPWDENSATWMQAASGSPWTRGGADGVGADRSDTVIGEAHLIATQRDYTWDLSSAVGGWFANPAQNYGVLFRGEDGANVLYQFNSSDCTPAASCGPWIELFVEFPPPTATPTPTPLPTDTPVPTATPTPTLTPTA
ncbi:MAG: DNRLRE domain-containing protein, partial [Chloroflexi bacterium]|nr:DNRLRE domain-containing protein [Chloroflexota bacterium]